SRVLVVGVAYKQDIDDYRESPALEVIELLKAAGATVEYYDPWIGEYRHRGNIMKGMTAITPQQVETYDLLLITAA
ncbi:UDP-N-acetyl-D-glucosamine dehydrogenase, partial [Klebsiella oxytoca]